MFLQFLSFCLLVKYSYSYNGTECVIRESGACKVKVLTKTLDSILVNTFGELPPPGYQLYTTIEVNYLANKYSFIENMIVEQTTPTYYNLQNTATITILIGTPDVSEYLTIELGHKFYGLATFQYQNLEGEQFKKYNHYTPDLPTFPYILHIEITKNGTFSIYNKGHIEPFFQYELDENFTVWDMGIAPIPSPSGEQPELVAFYDCSIVNSPNCGTYSNQNLYNCREKFEDEGDVHGSRIITGFSSNENIIFDEYVVVNNKYQSSISFNENTEAGETLIIEFQQNIVEIQATFNNNNSKLKKTARTKQWLEYPGAPFLVRVLITNGTDDNYIHLIDMRNETVVKLNLCGEYSSLSYMEIHGKVYFDCIRTERVENNIDRPRKPFLDYFSRESVIYDEEGLNFSKSYLYKDKNVDEPLFLYYYDNSIISKYDWCDGMPLPEPYYSYNTNAYRNKVDSTNLTSAPNFSNVSVIN